MRRSLLLAVCGMTALAVSLSAQDVSAAKLAPAVKSGVPFAQGISGPLLADIYLPAGNGPFPGVLYIHGGGWTSGTREQMAKVSKDLASHGFAGMAIDYDMTPQDAHFPAALHQAKEAVRWFRTHASEYHVDPDRIAVIGSSAGGELAALVGLTNNDSTYEGTGGNLGTPSTVEAVAVFNGVLDLAALGSSKMVTGYLGGACADLAAQCKDASPISHVHKGVPPFYVGHGTADKTVPYSQAVKFVKELQDAGVTVKTFTAQDGPHTYWIKPEWYDKNLADVEHFLDDAFAAVGRKQTAGPSEVYDVVVVSGSSGGFGAALAAGRMGAHVALIEDSPVLGGMLSNGVSNIDTFSYESLSGIFDEFRLHVQEHYRAETTTDPIFQMKFHASPFLDGRSQQSNLPDHGGRWEPHVAAEIFRTMLARQPNVEVFYSTIPTGVIMQGHQIVGVTARGKNGADQTFRGRVIIDATHEGDIAAWAGVPYSIGREARSPLEPHAGRLFYFDWTGEIEPGSTGEQDRAIPSSGYRLTVEDYAATGKQAPLLARPDGYRAEDYTASGEYKFSEEVPHHKTEFNVNPVGTELPGGNWDWPELKPMERKALQEKYRNHALGYLYYLQHERHQTGLGLPEDEYLDNDHVPYRMFLREGRRIHGEVTMTEADINPFVLGRGLTLPFRTDSIAIGHYPIDAKATREKTDLSTPDKGDGNFFLVNVVQPFQIPYGAIVPQGVDGLLVPVALSATHVAFSAIRMDPTWMALGQAAGTAAVLSLREHTSVHDVSLTELQRNLLEQRCRLTFFWDVDLNNPFFSSIDRLTLLTGFDGGDRREFQPDAPLARSIFASWLMHAEHLPPSVSNQHFKDVPWKSPEFREIETLYDAGQLGHLDVEPQWPKFGRYSQEKFGGFSQSMAFTEFHPERAVSWKELLETLHAIQTSTGTSFDPAHFLAELAKGSPIDASSIDLDKAVQRKEASAILVAFFSRQPS